jgi:hypothetical protein
LDYGKCKKYGSKNVFGPSDSTERPYVKGIAAPPTRKQEDYLALLCERAGKPIVIPKSKRAASEKIERLRKALEIT